MTLPNACKQKQCQANNQKRIANFKRRIMCQWNGYLFTLHKIIIIKTGVETVFIQELLVNYTINCKEISNIFVKEYKYTWKLYIICIYSKLNL